MTNASSVELRRHWHIKTGPRILSTITSIESAIWSRILTVVMTWDVHDHYLRWFANVGHHTYCCWDLRYPEGSLPPLHRTCRTQHAMPLRPHIPWIITSVELVVYDTVHIASVLWLYLPRLINNVDTTHIHLGQSATSSPPNLSYATHGITPLWPRITWTITYTESVVHDLTYDMTWPIMTIVNLNAREDYVHWVGSLWHDTSCRHDNCVSYTAAPFTTFSVSCLKRSYTRMEVFVRF